jgi:cation diffusion facilitator family transporter
LGASVNANVEARRKIDFFDGEVCTKIGLWVNILLTGIKLAAGILGHSKAMVADSLHSASDVLATGIVFVGLRISRKPADTKHPYGHGNADTIASFLVALILLLTGLYLGYSALHVLIHGHSVVPGSIALYAAIGSIVIKESLYQYTIRVGKRLNSQAIIANAWDHRSDAFSSVPALVGISIARLWNISILDPIAGLIIAVMIFRIAMRLMHSSVDIIMDESPDKATIQQISKIASDVSGVTRLHEVKVHQRGADRTVDIKIEVDGRITVNEGHGIASEVKAALIESNLRVVDAMVHVDPAVEDGQAAGLSQ